MEKNILIKMRKKIKIISIFGTRPEAIKLSPVILGLQRDSRFESKVIVTGQHRQMLDSVLSVFEITPDYDLNVMQPNQTLNSLTCRILQGVEPILLKERPDCILVQGDTTTVLATALAAFYLKIPVGHVEAGLRTEDRYNPFPEEINRRLTSPLSDIHFCPTERAKKSLINEGISSDIIHITQNTVIDALLHVIKTHRTRPTTLANIDFSKKVLAVTMHRRENQGDRMKEICQALLSLCKNFHDIEIVIPLHLSPGVQSVVRNELNNNERIHIIDPIDYLDFTYLLQNCHLVLTDSGGVQEEAPSLGKPVLVLRDVTERPEGVEAGINFIVGTNQNKILEMASRFINDGEYYNRVAQRSNPYGDGRASERIIELLVKRFISAS